MVAASAGRGRPPGRSRGDPTVIPFALRTLQFREHNRMKGAQIRLDRFHAAAIFGRHGSRHGHSLACDPAEKSHLCLNGCSCPFGTLGKAQKGAFTSFAEDVHEVCARSEELC